jgi:mRNA interferase MazF
MAQETYQRGSVVLVRFPFTDLTGSKVRPAVIVTPNKYLAESDDVLCAFISSSIPSALLPTDIPLHAEDAGFAQLGLKRSSLLRPHKLVLLNRSLVHSKLGDLTSSLLNAMNNALIEALGLH